MLHTNPFIFYQPYYYYPHFTDEKTGTQVGSPSGDHTASKFGTMIQKLVLWIWNYCSFFKKSHRILMAGKCLCHMSYVEQAGRDSTV